MKQKSIKFIEFMKRFQTEEQCREFLFNLRWSKGFICHRCGNMRFFEVKNRRVCHCLDCGHQASITANTISHRSHTPLNKWFLAISLRAQDKRVPSAARLAQDIEASPPWLHKIVSNLKAFITGTFHDLDRKHLQRYFDEFAYRFNRRKFQSELFSRLLKTCLFTNAITY